MGHLKEFLPPKPEEEDAHALLADEVVAKSGIDLEDERLSKRLFDIIVAFIKDVRDDAETKNMLTKPAKTGGMEFDDGKAASLMLFAKEAKARVEEKKAEIEEEMEAYEKMVRLAEEKQQENAAEGSASAPSGFTKDDAKRIFAGSDEERESLKAYVAKMAALESADQLKQSIIGLAAQAEGGTAIDPLELTVGLSILSGDGSLIDALSDDKFREPLLKPFPEEEAHQVRQRLIADVKSPETLSSFLKGVYRNVAGVSEEESARLGLRVVKALQKAGQGQYADLVAFDMDNGVFVWTK